MYLIVIPAKAGIQDSSIFTGFPVKLGMTENQFLIINLTVQFAVISNSKAMRFVAKMLEEKFCFVA